MMKTDFVDLAGGRIAVSNFGDGNQVVLMVPGMGALRSEYRYLAPEVASAGFRCITADLRGHGESSVPWEDYHVESVGSDLLELANYADSQQVHLVGTSKSAGAVVWAAAEAPALIRSIVLIGPFVHDTPTSLFMKFMMWILMKNPWNVSSWLSYYRTLYPSGTPDDFDEYLTELSHALRVRGRMKAAYDYGAASLAETDKRLRKLSIPTLVVMGSRDPDFPDPQKEASLVARESGGEMKMIDGAGHYPQTEMPDRTNPIIVDFLKRAAGQAIGGQSAS